MKKNMETIFQVSLKRLILFIYCEIPNHQNSPSAVDSTKFSINRKILTFAKVATKTLMHTIVLLNLFFISQLKMFENTQPVFTCSRLTIETLNVKYVQS